jgi:hypothetical protein
MLHEALTGVLPQGAFPPPSRVNAVVPSRVDAVVMRLLQPRPADRYAGAVEVAQALEAALMPTPAGRRTTRIAAAALTSLVLGGAGIAWRTMDPGPPPRVEETYKRAGDTATVAVTAQSVLTPGAATKTLPALAPAPPVDETDATTKAKAAPKQASRAKPAASKGRGSKTAPMKKAITGERLFKE